MKSYLDVDTMEFKALDSEPGVIEGYASTFGNIDRHGDIIAKGAFDGGASKVPIFALHDPALTVGVGRVTEDAKGLKINIKLAIDAKSETLRKRAEEYYDLVRMGIVERMSVGFAPLETDFEQRKIKGKDHVVRVIKKVDLMEVSLVPIPANDKAKVTAVKSYGEVDEPPTATETQLDEQKNYYSALIAKQLGVF